MTKFARKLFNYSVFAIAIPANVACPPSLVMMTGSGEPLTRQATPRPVPGPKTALGASSTILPPPIAH